MKINKRILIKLGSKCNLSCPHCHSSKNVEYVFNDDIIKYIKDNGIQTVVFSGGEPLIYFDYIKKIIECVDDVNMRYRLVTNGFLLDMNKIEFFNTHKVTVSISYDGEDGNREYPPEDKLKLLKYINNLGTAVTVYKQNINKVKLTQDIIDFGNAYGTPLFYYPNFIHQTDNNNIDDVDMPLLLEYIKQISEIFELALYRFKKSGTSKYNPLLVKIVQMFILVKFERGCQCCNENRLMMRTDGKFLLCPYGSNVVGDIYTGVDWELVESYIPDKCKKCPLWTVCGNPCIENKTDNECFIYRNLYIHFLKLCTRYNISEDELIDILKH